MSVEDLVLSDLDHMTKMFVTEYDNGKIKFEIDSQEAGDWLYIDRNQAHLLKLWLEEHLK